MILGADVGGTKTVVALFEQRDRRLHEQARRAFPSAEFPGFEEILDAFLDEHDRPAVSAAGVAAAGPVVDGSVQLTNLPWRVLESGAVARVLGGAHVAVLNDLQGMAVGMLDLPPDQRVALNPHARPRETANRAVIAAGTGLGEALLVWDGARYLPVATEGGHGGFAPDDDEQDALLRFLRTEHGGRVSWERVLSGPGLASVYRFARERSGTPEPSALRDAMAAGDPSAAVAEAGLDGSDAVCARALELFAALYGSEAGDLALRSLALGGVYVGGGIAPKLLPVLEGGAFLRAFVAKGRFAGMLGEVPVEVCLEPATPLLGAARWAADASA